MENILKWTYKCFWTLALIVSLLSIAGHADAQNTLELNVNDSIEGVALPGVIVKGPTLSLSAATDSLGNAVITNIPDGYINFSLSLSGYVTKNLRLHFPTAERGTIKIVLQPIGEELETVTVSTTRTGSRIADLPMKVEVLGADDMEEENGIKPGNVNSILGDVSVIHLQQTSQITGNTAVRMQGLDGKYTQLLRDGLPLYEGFSGSFGVLQVPPLDLRQVEVIKGSVSTLYGGGAISGLINLISKEPVDSPQTSFTVNQSTLLETNLNAYYAKKSKYTGLTLFAGSNLQQAVDVNKDGFSDVPEVRSMLFHPKVFFYLHPQIRLNLGFSTLFESRTGGDMLAIQTRPDSLHRYYEKNNTDRKTIDMHFDWNLRPNQSLGLKGTTSLFNRDADQSGSLLSGRQLSSYYELAYNYKTTRQTFVAGSNLTSEQFRIRHADSLRFGNYAYNTLGFFIQDGWQLHPKLLAEAGLRYDFHNTYGQFFLPRLAFLYKPIYGLAVRLNAGTGYKTPNIFNTQTLSERFTALEPLPSGIKAERSAGLNCDINYMFLIPNSKIIIYLNQAFYYTIINNPILLIQTPSRSILQVNSPLNTTSKGSDTYLRIKREELEIYLGYNHTIANYSSGKKDFVLFSPQDKFSTTLAYEFACRWRIGIESSWIANQYIAQAVKGHNYWLWATMIEKKFDKFSLVLNGENLLDIRQSRYEAIVLPPISRPVFKALYAPIDGRVINLSLRISI